MYESDKNTSLLRLSIKYIFNLKSMHFFCFFTPLVILSFFLPLNFFVLNFDFNDLKLFSINTMIFVSCLIPFGFFPIIIDTIKWNHATNTSGFIKKQYLKFFLSLLLLFFLYYLFVIFYMLLVIILIGQFIRQGNNSFFDYIFSNRPFNGSYFNNSINWSSFIFVLPFCFLFCYSITIPLSWIFVRKNLLIVLIISYIIYFALSPFIIPSYSILPTYQWYKNFYLAGIFYYPGMMFSFAFSGINIFHLEPLTSFNDSILFSRNFIVIIYSIFYVLPFVLLSIELTITILRKKWFDIVSYLYSRNRKNKILAKIISQDKNLGITTHSVYVSRQISRRIYKLSRRKTDIVCIASNVDSFIPEFSFIENFMVIKSIYKYDYNTKVLNDLIYLLNLQLVVTKKMNKLLPRELIILNLLYALLLNPKKIIFINPSKHISNSILIETLEVIKNYVREFNIKLVIINKNIKQLDILCDEIVDIKNANNITTYSVEEWKNIIDDRKRRIEQRRQTNNQKTSNS